MAKHGRLIDADFLGLTDMEIIMCDGDYKEALKMLIDKIEHAPTIEPEPKWIPCSERLPKQGQEVICQCRANIIMILKLDADGDWFQDVDHCYMSGFVIAWMPIPEPYKAESEDKE